MQQLTFTTLYVAEQPSDMASALAAQGYDLHQATSCHEALAMLIYHLPHVTILDGDTPAVHEALWHMLNVTGPSPRIVDMILMLTDDELSYELPPYILLVTLPANTPPAEVLARLPALLEAQAEQAARLMIQDRHDLSSPVY